MGKKAKTGKARKDKFYRLAKETGYRARSAFKLLQLNRKFEFLQKSRVCVDLCAAPGSWLQVAVNHMPVSSHIIGFDLVPIKSIYGVSTFQEDITTEKCRQILKKELQTWQVDVVLHDGAPNVGSSWVQDAFSQAELTLSALKLASEFLRKDGWFVTKVFRSKDYHALLWVFGQLFRKVHATKPQASRNESAEIFVVCQGFKAPHKIDPKFLDPKYVFQDVGPEPRKPINLIHPEKEKKKAEGYAEGDYTLHTKVNVTDFFTADNHLELLANCSQLVIDSKAIANHPLTTIELKECCKDIKLLGKKELRDILTWRKKIKQSLEKILKAQEEKEKKKQEEESSDESEKEMDVGSAADKHSSQEAVDVEELELDSDASEEEGQDEDQAKPSKEDQANDSANEEEEKVKEQLAELQDEERKNLKRKRKKVMKEKRKLRDKLSLNMVIPGDRLDVTDDISLFDLKKIKSKKQLDDVETEDLSDHEGIDIEEGVVPEKSRKYMMAYDRYATNEADMDDGLSESDGAEYGEDDSGEESVEEKEEDQKVKPLERNPLVVDLEKKQETQKTDRWFNKDIFAGLEAEEDEDVEIGKMMEDYRKRGGVILEKEKKDKKSKKSKKKKEQSSDSDSGVEENISDDEQEEMDTNENQSVKDAKNLKGSTKTSDLNDSESNSDSDSDNSDSDSDSNQSGSDYEVLPSYIQRMKKSSKDGKVQNKASRDGFEIVTAEETASVRKKLDPVALAIGEELIKSSKRRRELTDESYNRYTFEDDHLPAWFTQDESRHMRKPLPVSKAKIEAYKERMKAINARPIKKIAEAEARKKKKSMRKLERARKRAETVNDAVDTTDKEKWKSIKEIYKKAGLLRHKKEDIAYVVAKKGTSKKVSRPAGIKGRFKVVDSRLKKDLRNGKIRDKKLKKQGKPPMNKGNKNKQRNKGRSKK